MADYQGLKDWLYSLQVFGIKLGLSSTQALLKRLGDPQNSFPSVHLAGTNGKGSSAAMLASVLTAAGLKVGLYTSPHLVSFRERFLVAGRMPSRQRLAQTMAQVRAVVVDQEPPTFFEFTTALAFEYFKEQGVDLAVIETGLGGRLDATNVLLPKVVLISDISVEHTQHLGASLKLIAWEKAGIIKPGRPVATQALKPQAARVVEARAKELKAPLFRLGREFKARWTRTGLSYKGLSWEMKGLKMELAGRHQGPNAALALAGLELLAQDGLDLSQEAVRRGLAEVVWPGRLHTISAKPRLILDGAHNPGACRALVRTLERIERRRLIVVLGAMADKDLRSMVRILGRAADRLILTRAAYERSAQPRQLARLAQEMGFGFRLVPELMAALAAAQAAAGPEDLIVVTGSLFIVGEVLAGLNMPTFPEDA